MRDAERKSCPSETSSCTSTLGSIRDPWNTAIQSFSWERNDCGELCRDDKFGGLSEKRWQAVLATFNRIS
jgi:hypothetical protein